MSEQPNRPCNCGLVDGPCDCDKFTCRDYDAGDPAAADRFADRAARALGAVTVRWAVHHVEAFRAECVECGWEGPLRDMLEFAHGDAVTHIATHDAAS